VKWSDLPREKAVCALCGSDSPVLLKRSRGWPVSRCPVCGLVYLTERPTEASLASMYSNEYYDRAEVGYGGYASNFAKYADIFAKLFKARVKSLERYRGGAAVCLNSAAPTASFSIISVAMATVSPGSR